MFTKVSRAMRKTQRILGITLLFFGLGSAATVYGQTTDDFNRANSTDLGPNWTQGTGFEIKNNQLVMPDTSSSYDGFDDFWAVHTQGIDPNSVKFTFGADSDELGRQYSGLLVLVEMDAQNKPNGYLIFRPKSGSTYRLKLFEVQAGVVVGGNIQDVPSKTNTATVAGDAFQVAFYKTGSTRTFNVYRNGTHEGTLVDTQGLQGGAGATKAGVMINNNTNNAVDDFFMETEIDNTPPAAITLAAGNPTTSSIDLSWTSVGDDGTVGQAISYDIRYSTTAITALSFDGEQQIGGPVPKSAGAGENLTVNGLTAETTYFFAIKAIDEFGNAGAISNVPSTATTADGGGGGGGGGGYVPTSLVTQKDDFERAGPNLGANWSADATLNIVGGTVQTTTSAPDAFDYGAVFTKVKKPYEISFKWGANADANLLQYSGLFIAKSATDLANGYLVQRRVGSPSKTVLYEVTSGVPGTELGSGDSQSTDPTPGSELKVALTFGDLGELNITVTVDGTFDREFQVASPGFNQDSDWWGGFILNNNVGGTGNELDEFSVAVEPTGPTDLNLVSGNNQEAPVSTAFPQPVVLELLDSNGEAVVGEEIEFIVDPANAVTFDKTGDGNIRKEAENGIIDGAAGIADYMLVKSDPNASGGKYVTYDVAAGSPGPDGWVQINFNIPETATYYIWMRYLGSQNSVGSYSYKIELDEDGDQFLYELGFASNWRWVKILKNGGTFTPTLDAGSHNIRFHAWHDQTWLDKILITKDPNYTPQDEEPSQGYVTNTAGRVSAGITAGDTPGPVTLTAQYGELSTPVSLTITADDAATISRLNVSSIVDGPAGTKDTLAVRIDDDKGNPVAGYKVQFVVTQGGGYLNTADPVISDVNGVAEVILTYGAQAGLNIVEAFAAGLAGSPATFVPKTTSGLASRLELISGNNQSATAGEALNDNIVVRVQDQTGAGVKDYPLSFVTIGDGGTTNKNHLIMNSDLEGEYVTKTDDFGDVGDVAPGWNSWRETDAAMTHSKVAGYLSQSAQRINVTGMNGASISQSLTNLPATDQRLALSFYYKITGTTNPAINIELRKNSDDKMEELTLPPIAGGWKHFVHYFTYDAVNYDVLSLHLIVNKDIIVDLDQIRIEHVSDANGELDAIWTLGNPAGTQNIKAEAFKAGSPLFGSPKTFTATAEAGDPFAVRITKGADPKQSGAVNTALPIPFEVQVTDKTGNGIANHPVEFHNIQGGGLLDGSAVSPKIILTDASGFAAVTLTLGPNANTENIVQIFSYLNSATLDGSGELFYASTAEPSMFSVVSPENQQGSAGLPLPDPIEILVQDVGATPISGYPVQFRVVEGGGNFNGETLIEVPTGANGRAVVSLTLGNEPGALNSVEASVGFSQTSKQINATAADLKQIMLLDGNNQIGTVGSELGQPLKVRVIDMLNNGIPNWLAEFSVTNGGGHLGNNDTQKQIYTDNNGVAQVNFFLGPIAGTGNNTVDAFTDYKGQPLSGSPITFSASAKAGAPKRIEIVGGNNQKGVVGNPLAEPLQVKITDDAGNGIVNHSVVFTVKLGGGKLQGATTRTVKTDINGIASASFSVGSTAGVDNNKVEASAKNGTTPLENSPVTFIASGTANSAYSLAYIGGNNQVGSAGQILDDSLVVVVKDRQGNPVGQHPVEFKVIKGGGKLNGTTDTTFVDITDAQGRATTSWYLGGALGNLAQELQATSTDGQDLLLNAPIVFKATAKAGLPDSLVSYIDAITPVMADGQTKSEIVIHLRDKFDNPYSGGYVTIQVSGEGNNIEQPVTASDAEGVVKAYVSSRVAGIKTVTAIELTSGVHISSGTIIQFLAQAASKISLHSGNGQERNLGTVLENPFVVKVTDVNDNPIFNHAINFKIEAGTGYILEQQPVRTDSSGLANVSFVLGQSGSNNTVRAYADGLSGSPISFSATGHSNAGTIVIPGPGDDQSAAAGELLPEAPGLKVLDASGNPVFGHLVTYEVTYGGGSINGQPTAQIRTDAFGLARVNWRLGPNVGPNIMQAIASGISITTTFQAYGTSGTAYAIKALSALTQVGSVNQKLGGGLSVRVTDKFDNPVSGVIISYSLVKGTGVLSDVQKVSNEEGFANVDFTFGADAGERQIRVSGNGLVNSPVTFNLTAAASAATSMSLVDGNQQKGTVNKFLSYPQRVLVTDINNNPVANTTVSFIITQGGGSMKASQVTTDERGYAAAFWKLGSVVGQNGVKAILDAKSSETVNFTAQSETNNFPAFVEIPSKVLNEGSSITFTVAASDADGDPITLSAKNKPAGAIFNVNGNRRFEWTTTSDDAGFHDVIFVANDGKGGVSEYLVTIKVNNTNRAPIISSSQPSESAVFVGNRPEFEFSVSAVDADGDQLSYLWYLDGKHVASTSVYVYKQGSGKLHTIEVRVTDGKLEATRRWDVTNAVQLVNFSASALAASGVTLHWVTANEIDNFGYNILRSIRRDDGYVPINAELIKPDGSGNYSFVDVTAVAGERYYYKLEDVSYSGAKEVHGPVVVIMDVPQSFSLSQNYPNPFNPSTNIRFQLPENTDVMLKIFNTLGQEVKTLVNRQMSPGMHTVLWDGRGNSGTLVPSGVYYYQIRAGQFHESRKMLLLK
ncbi:MAG: T9SS C-terminal target domain-containing protein [Calditrichaeota bacterium]|nr:MAG: T9SS C-terminal target domain-containing protein [Calditrichota bacterium]